MCRAGEGTLDNLKSLRAVPGRRRDREWLRGERRAAPLCPLHIYEARLLIWLVLT